MSRLAGSVVERSSTDLTLEQPTSLVGPSQVGLQDARSSEQLVTHGAAEVRDWGDWRGYVLVSVMTCVVVTTCSGGVKRLVSIFSKEIRLFCFLY